MTGEIIWTILSGILILLGIAGTILPFLPGAPLALAGLLLYGVVTDFADFSGWMVGIFVCLTVLTFVIDVFGPAIGARRQRKSSRSASMGAVIGAVFGIFILGPVGVLIGPLIGAFAGEFLASRDLDQAARSARGAFFAFLVGTAVKLGIVFAMAGYFIYLLF
jgi:uncharacterized protein YqgC (DUF456 family)